MLAGFQSKPADLAWAQAERESKRTRRDWIVWTNPSDNHFSEPRSAASLDAAIQTVGPGGLFFIVGARSAQPWKVSHRIGLTLLDGDKSRR